MGSRFDEFALEINEPGDLNEPLRSVYIEALQDGPCRVAIYAPKLSNVPSRHVQPPATYLLLIFDRRILVAADSGKRNVTITRMPLDDVLCVETGHVLLFCWFKIVFGRQASLQIKIPFNLVRFELFREALTSMRARLDQKYQGGDVKSLKSIELDIKFRNAFDEVMLADEVPLHLAFQPEIRTRRFLMLERQVMPPLLAAMTNRQFLLVTEEPPTSVERLGRVNAIYTYCPHERIESLNVEANEHEEHARLVLTLANESARFVINAVVSKDLGPKFRELSKFVTGFLERRSPSVLA